MTLEEMKQKLKQSLTAKRYKHSINVMETASDLADTFKVDKKKAQVAGLLHDCAKNISIENTFKLCKKFNIEIDSISSVQPRLLHGPLGRFIAETEYGVNDKQIFDAIYCHTTGRENMTMLDKIIFIADYIEPGRKFEGIEEIRKKAYVNIDESIVMALNSTIMFVIAKGKLIHPNTILARNFIIRQSY